MTIPAKPSEDTPQAWSDWAEEHYPYDPVYAAKFAERRVNPPVGSELELKTLSIIPPGARVYAAFMARLWFYGLEHVREIESAQAEDKLKRIEAEKSRLIGLAREAIAGRLGYSDQQKSDAATIAKAYLTKPPESCSWEELSDWWAMHRYGQACAKGRNVPRPRLHNERKADKQREKDIDEIGDSLGAVQGELGW